MAKPDFDIADINRTFDRLQEVVDLVGRVLAKFPAETVPKTLQSFIGSSKVVFARTSGDDDGSIIVSVDHMRLFDKPRQLHIPTAWVQMHQSELTSTVRDLCWADRDRKQHREIARLETSIASHERYIASHTRHLAKERAEHEALVAELKKRADKKSESTT